MRVVHCKTDRYTHYIGRPSPFGNPFSHKPSKYVAVQVQDRAEAIRRFEEWARKSPAVLEAIKALPEDAVLGCWCKPLDCHGDVIITLWKELHAKQRD